MHQDLSECLNMSDSEQGAQKASLELSHIGSLETPQLQPKRKEKKKKEKQKCDSSGIEIGSSSEPDRHVPGCAEAQFPTIVVVSDVVDRVDLDADMEDCGACFCDLLSALCECFCCIFELLGSLFEDD